MYEKGSNETSSSPVGLGLAAKPIISWNWQNY